MYDSGSIYSFILPDFFCTGGGPKSGPAEILATAYNPGMCLLALTVINCILFYFE